MKRLKLEVGTARPHIMIRSWLGRGGPTFAFTLESNPSYSVALIVIVALPIGMLAMFLLLCGCAAYLALRGSNA